MEPVVTVPRALARRIRRGQAWIRRIDWARAHLPLLPAGAFFHIVEKESKDWIAIAYFNPHSQIVARVVSRTRARINEDFWHERLQQAWRRRQAWLSGWSGTNAFRWVNADGDGMPGLVVDYYDGFVVIQILTLGMETQRDAILSALQAFPIRGIAEKSVGRARRQEGLEDRVTVVWGEVPPVLTIQENDVLLPVNWLEGHKTGFYLDQRENRAWVKVHAQDRRVLDLCAYTGSFSFTALAGGAREVVAVESNRRALEVADTHARNQGLEGRIEWVQADVFDYLRHLVRHNARFDLIILDPPPLAPTRQALSNAVRAYRELNRQAMRLLAPNGWLLTCACSHHVRPEVFLRVVRQAASSVPRYFRIVAWRHQPPDHPPVLAIPETTYFQALILQRME